MSTVSACPYCGVQLALSSMRAHVVLCSQGISAKSASNGRASQRTSSSSSASRVRSATSCATTLEVSPSRSSSRRSPPTLRVDLRHSLPSPQTNGDVYDLCELPDVPRRASPKPPKANGDACVAEWAARVGALESALGEARAEVAALRALVAGAAKSAEAAHRGVQSMEQRVAHAADRTELEKMRCEMAALQSAVQKATLASKPVAHRRQSIPVAAETEEMVARLLQLQPAAVMRIADKSAVSVRSDSRGWS